MNNFKEGGGGFKRGGSFGGRPKFGGNRGGGAGFGGKRRGNNFGGNRERSDKPAQMHSATCAECGKSCEVPFKPSSDKPVYCSNCFGKKNDDNKGDERRESNFRSDARPQREERRPQFDKPRGNDNELKQQLATIESKLNKILELINPPMKAGEKVEVSVVVKEKKKKKKEKSKPVKKEVDKPALKAAVAEAVKKTAAKSAPKKAVAKKAVKKVVAKKVAKKLVKKAK
ncbi:hypothetical protein KC872_01660 [Candidatus Kaiserbacteria bacterium]|nr:hypothetical protein [Candidatus Kaiserbacteria bacterium]